MGTRLFLYDSDTQTPYILVNAGELPIILPRLRDAGADFIVTPAQQGVCKIQFPSPSREKLMQALTKIASDLP